jgi:hypothetical protein
LLSRSEVVVVFICASEHFLKISRWLFHRCNRRFRLNKFVDIEVIEVFVGDDVIVGAYVGQDSGFALLPREVSLVLGKRSLSGSALGFTKLAGKAQDVQRVRSKYQMLRPIWKLLEQEIEIPVHELCN